MSVTPNFGWPLIEPTDFVTNLPADFEAFGDAVDLDVDAIKTTADAAQPNVITTEGDLVVGDASGDPDRLPIGAVGTVLTSDGDTAEWAAPVGASKSYTLLNSGNIAVGSGASFTVSGISGIDDLMIMFQDMKSAAFQGTLQVIFNSDTGTNYESYSAINIAATTYAAGNFAGSDTPNGTQIDIARVDNGMTGNSRVHGSLRVFAANSTDAKPFMSMAGGSPSGGSNHTVVWRGGVYKGTSAITSITVQFSSGNLATGNLLIYGSA
jgi:hypothetical protein